MRGSTHTTTNTTTKTRTLDEIGSELRVEVRAAEEDFQSAVAHAMRAGEVLIEAKAQIPHGGWLPWLEANCPLSERQARNYMRLARNRQRVADLPSIREAVALLSAPKLEPSDVGQLPTNSVIDDIDYSVSMIEGLVDRSQIDEAAALSKALLARCEPELEGDDVDVLRTIYAQAQRLEDLWKRTTASLDSRLLDLRKGM